MQTILMMKLNQLLNEPTRNDILSSDSENEVEAENGQNYSKN